MNNSLSVKYARLYGYLNNFSVYDIRNLARAMGVPSPTLVKKGELIDQIVRMCAGLSKPAPRSNKGAPAKGAIADARLDEVRSILAVIEEGKIYEATEVDTTLRMNDSGIPHISALSGEEVNGYLDCDGEDRYYLVSDYNGSTVTDFGVPETLVYRYGLRCGDKLRGTIELTAGKFKISELKTVDGYAPGQLPPRKRFESIPTCLAKERFTFGNGNRKLRAIDLLNPLGKGQRALISGAAATGKTTLLQNMLRTVDGIDYKVVVLTVAARPADIEAYRSICAQAEIFSTTFDMPKSTHLQIASVAFEYAKRYAEWGKDVIMFIDSITDLAFSYADGAFNPSFTDVKQLFAQARNFDEDGSLTVLATVRTDDRDERVQSLYRELSSAANFELSLSRELRNRRIFPPIAFGKSSSYQEDRLLSEDERNCSARLKNYMTDPQIQIRFYEYLSGVTDCGELLAHIEQCVLQSEGS